ncbi:MAG: flagellar basal body-associated FliL family protein [Pseudomonadota bacterium]
MSDDKPKNNLLSSELDFEGLDDMLASPRVSSQPDPLSDLVFETPKEFVRKPEVPSPSPQVAKASPPVRKAIASAKTFEPPRMPPKRKIAPAPVKQDRFTLYAIAVVIVALLTISFGVYYSRLQEGTTVSLKYIVLPEVIVNIDGLIARAQVTIQVDDADTDWLQANKKALSDSFANKFLTLNLEDLRTPQGMADAQIELKDLINHDLKTDKVEAVLITELVIQEQT